MTRKRRSADITTVAPSDLVSSELKIGGQKLVVVSFPIDAQNDARWASLTEAEREVVELVLAGKTNAAIATTRRTSARTVANQIASILKKLGMKSRREVLSYGK